MQNFTKLIVGLGNPGLKYKNTRHNIGFLVLKRLCDKLHVSSLKKNKYFHLFKKRSFLFLFPLTYMNRSGIAVKMIKNEFDINANNIMTIVDDINLELGEIRIRKKGSAGGHNGLRSIIAELDTISFKRFRIGISSKPNNSPDRISTKDYVLEKFSEEELEKLESTFEKSVTLLNNYLFDNYKKMLDNYSKLNSLSQ